MSYTAPPAGPPARQRPGSVSAAVWLMYFVAVLFLVSGVIAVLVHGAMSDVFERAFADDPQLGEEGATAAAVAATGVSLAIAAIFAAGLFVLGALVARGSNAARIITWVVAGVGVCCTGWAFVSTLARNAMTGLGGGSGSTDPAELQRLMDELLPSWWAPVGLTVSVLQLLSLLAIIVLLALPAANAFFRQARPAWEPPAPSYPPLNPPPGPGYPPPGPGYPPVNPPPPGS